MGSIPAMAQAGLLHSIFHGETSECLDPSSEQGRTMGREMGKPKIKESIYSGICALWRGRTDRMLWDHSGHMHRRILVRIQQVGSLRFLHPGIHSVGISSPP